MVWAAGVLGRGSGGWQLAQRMEDRGLGIVRGRHLRRGRVRRGIEESAGVAKLAEGDD